MAKYLEIKQVKSASKLKPKQAQTLKALGLRGPGSVIHRTDLRAIRGMLNHLHHIIEARLIDNRVEKKSKTSTTTRDRGVKVLA
jgi:ribosomal protein L30